MKISSELLNTELKTEEKHELSPSVSAPYAERDEEIFEERN